MNGIEEKKDEEGEQTDACTCLKAIIDLKAPPQLLVVLPGHSRWE